MPSACVALRCVRACVACMRAGVMVRGLYYLNGGMVQCSATAQQNTPPHTAQVDPPDTDRHRLTQTHKHTHAHVYTCLLNPIVSSKYS